MNKLSNIFNIEYGQRGLGLKTDIGKGRIPLISSGGLNNGVFGFFDLIPKYKNVISVPRVGTIGHAFYQGVDCCIDDNCLVMIPKKDLSIEDFFYYVLLVRYNKYRFMYGRQITPKKLGEITIPNKIPDFIYNSKIPDYGNIKESLNKEKLSLNDIQFDYFEIQTLFEVKGTKTTKKYVLEESGSGEFPYITTQSTNNGVNGYYNLRTEKGFVLTVDSAVTGFCSYQEKDFSASDHVEKLIPKFEINKFIGKYLTTIINKENYRYNYGRKFNQERIKNTRIKLPVDKNGNPDRQFMEDYIKSLPYSSSL